MAERQTKPAATEQGPTNDATQEGSSAAYAVAGRLQAGENAEVTTTRVPRGVGEPAADAKAEGFDGVSALQDHVFKVVEQENAQGFRGSQVDSTPNENYTLKGVGRGLPTPETTVYTPRGH